MIQKNSILFIFLVLISGALMAQPALPEFSIINGPKNHSIISWRNNFGDQLTVLTIQRSADSVRNFRTIYSVNNLSLQVNAYTDNKPVPGEEYYRMYYMLKNGSYNFTKAKRITTGFVADDVLTRLDSRKMIRVKGDLSGRFEYPSLFHLKDSVLNYTSDSLYFVNDSTLQYVKYNAVAAIASAETTNLQPMSKFLYLNADSYVVLKFPEQELSRYSMTIYKQNGTSVLFKIPKFENSEIILNKTSFLRSGWYPYEIYKDGKIEERSRLEIK